MIDEDLIRETLEQLRALDPHGPELVPPELRESLIGYATRGIPTGHFLQAVIANDLVDAYARADVFNTVRLPAIAAFIYNEMPDTCWGSRRVYAAWLELHSASRASERAREKGAEDAYQAALAREEKAITEVNAAAREAREQRRPVDR